LVQYLVAICCPFIGLIVVGKDGVKTDVKYLFRILATGPDEIPAYSLKETSKMAPILTFIFQASLLHSTF